MIELNQEIDIPVTVEHRPDFDYACMVARSNAVSALRIDDDGHTDFVKGYKRSEHCIKIEFVTVRMLGGMTGWRYLYEFKCWVE